MPRRVQYLVDEQGKRNAVVLDIASYRALLEAQEELEDIQAYDEAMASREEAVPLADVIREFKSQRHELPRGRSHRRKKGPAQPAQERRRAFSER